ncbi:MAG: hypothetical protein ABJA70_11060 [Chryseolinea sp.]
MNKYDEELQRNIENGLTPTGEASDARIYRTLFKSLSKPPVVNIPLNFADHVVAKVNEQQAQRSSRVFVWHGVGIVMLLLAAVVGFVYSGIKVDTSNFKQLAGIAGLVVFSIVFCGILNIIDRKVVAGKLESQW